MSPPSKSFSSLIPLLLMALRLVLGVALISVVLPLSVDDYFRVFQASWWWDHVSFTASREWLPGYSYIYGTAIGLFGDTVLTPRLLTLAFLLLMGAIFLARSREPRGVTTIALGWLLFSPLALLLGTIPLTEVVYMTFLVVGVLFLEAYLEDGRGVQMLLAASMYLLASTVRYEAWALFPLFLFLSMARRPTDVSRPVQLAIAMVPALYGVVWTLALWAAQGEPFLYLQSVKQDHFGPGSPLRLVATPLAALTLVQQGLVVAAVIVGLRSSENRKRGLRGLVWELHAIAALIILALVIVGGNVPSQLPVRIMFPALVFGAIPIGRLIAGIERPAWVVVSRLLLGAMGVAGVAAVFLLPSAVNQEDLLVGQFLRERFDSGDLGPRDHVVVEHELPNAAALFVYSNRRENVHVDNDPMGWQCPPTILLDSVSNCEMPEWAPNTKMGIVRSKGRSEVYLRKIGWRRHMVTGDWTVMVRPEGASYPGEGLVVPPDYVTPERGQGTLEP